MTPAEQSIINALVAAQENKGLIGGAAVLMLALLGWLGRRVYAGLGHAIKNAQQVAATATAAAKAADDNRREDTNTIHEKLDKHIAEDGGVHRQLLTEATEQTKIMGQIHASLERALGERPTRSEVRDMIELHQGRKSA
jgi:hypothetical protein